MTGWLPNPSGTTGTFLFQILSQSFQNPSISFSYISLLPWLFNGAQLPVLTPWHLADWDIGWRKFGSSLPLWIVLLLMFIMNVTCRLMF